MIEIDGSQGEGGGQIVRSSLALSLLTGRPFSIRNVRAGRAKPGLMRQHLTAVNAAARIGNACVTGAEVGSTEISFEPNPIVAGEYHFSIATAGSVTLVLQTVLPALMIQDQPSKIVLSGGTHNMMAPPFDFLQRSYLPQLAKMGPQVDLKLDSYGFYPAGGGQFTAMIIPTQSLAPLALTERGKLLTKRIRAIVSSLPGSIAKREIERVQSKLSWSQAKTEIVQAPNPRGPGNILFAELEHEHTTSVFTGFGKRGVSSEQVADNVVKQVRKYLKHDAPIGPHLADQLMLPMAIAARFHGSESCFRTGPLTMHSKTHIDIIQRFMEVRIACTQRFEESTNAETLLVEVKP